jgi:hypothetical protein
VKVNGQIPSLPPSKRIPPVETDVLADLADLIVRRRVRLVTEPLDVARHFPMIAAAAAGGLLPNNLGAVCGDLDEGVQGPWGVVFHRATLLPLESVPYLVAEVQKLCVLRQIEVADAVEIRYRRGWLDPDSHNFTHDPPLPADVLAWPLVDAPPSDGAPSRLG